MIKEQHTLTNPYNHHALSRYVDVYEVSANRCHSVPESGYKGTEATLVDEPAWNEKFSSYSITGATLTGNNFILNNDVTAQANYETAKNVDTINCIASPNSGFIGDTATLSDSPAWNEKFSSYSITGSTLTGNKFRFTGSDITAQANYETAKDVTTIRCSSTKESGFIGDTASLSNSPAEWNEKFSSYSITGSTLTGNNFRFTGSDITAQANFETAKNVTLQTDGHGSITANKNSGFIGDQVTLSNTAATNYSFSGYTITGATLTANKFNFTGSNVTAKVHYTYVGPVSISLISNATATAYCEATYNGETTAWTSNGTTTKDIPMGATIVFSAVVPKYYRVQNMVNTGIDNFITARGTGSDTNQRIISGTGVITGAGSISTNNTHLNKVYLTGSWSTTTANRQTWFANSGGASRLKACPTITTFKQAASLPSAESVKGTINANINLYGTTAKNRTMAWRDYTTANNLLDLRGASAVRNSGHLNITGYAYHYYGGWTANPSQRGLYCRGITAGTNSNAILIDGGFFVGGSKWSAASTKTTSYDYNYTGNGDFTGSTEAFYNGCLGVEVYAAMTEGGGDVSQTGVCLKYPVNQVYNINGSFIWSGILP